MSIGLAAVNRDSPGMQQVLSAADTACYVAKEQGRNRLHVHHTDDDELVRRHGEMQWSVRIPRALEEGRFQLYCQPMMPVTGAAETRTEHYEVLLQLRGDSGELVPTGAFLPAAERYNLSESLDRWVISQTLRRLREHPLHLQQLRICSLNLSGLALGEPCLSRLCHR